MSCSCRTIPLRIFVQSLTELQISDSVIQSTRRIQPRCLGTTAYLPRCTSTRLFSSSTALGLPRRTWKDSSSFPISDRKTRASQQPLDDVAEKSSVIELDTTTSDLTQAKLDGAVLDYSPESIDSIIASFRRSSVKDSPKKYKKYAKPPAPSRPGSYSRSFEGSSELKRRKIFKDDPPKYTQSDDEFRPKSESWQIQKEALGQKFPGDWSAPSTPGSDSGSFGGSSELKRRKIIKDEPKKDQQSDEEFRPQRESWQIQKAALGQKFPGGWSPRKRLSPDALEGIRALHSQFPEEFTTEVLSQRFQVSPEAIRRILKSKWKPSSEEEIDRQERWFKRGKQIWSQMAELGKKPPRKWRREGVVRDPSWNKKRGPRTHYPYVPRRNAQQQDREHAPSAQQKLSENLF
ncbi:hypothetical protein F4779DRAFT_571627 [Xylariaceae sp. FL0662B]|nr:hypothetical protein F4779DRAFT_571627 [Xylariaceae sp. FL0662B]